MTPEQLTEYRSLLSAGKVKPDKMSDKYAFHRAWNEGIEFAEKMADKVFGKEEPTA